MPSKCLLEQDGYPGRDIRSGWPYILAEEKKIQIKIDGCGKSPPRRRPGESRGPELLGIRGFGLPQE
jgi:hypothetical protein